MKKGIAFLKGEGPLNVRKMIKNKIETKPKGENKMANGNYTVVVDGQKI